MYSIDTLFSLVGVLFLFVVSDTPRIACSLSLSRALMFLLVFERLNASLPIKGCIFYFFYQMLRIEDEKFGEMVFKWSVYCVAVVQSKDWSCKD